MTYIGIQSLLIIGGNVRLPPLTGVTLPFVSYGGSSPADLVHRPVPSARHQQFRGKRTRRTARPQTLLHARRRARSGIRRLRPDHSLVGNRARDPTC
ncbi:MAG: FtsW/RodA/SpoVE family cell cycle protein [Chloroflexi bacterium]|nr:FtsW/RodA/SpoVE family cell cycle protein [Chloroflexota bacterium]